MKQKQNSLIMAYQRIDPDRENLQSAIDKVILEGEPIIFQREGQPVAALIPIEDLEILQELEDLEDKFDLEAAQEAMKEPGIVSWEDLKEKFGL
jgi:PHD/YefM family antitoxin component YafN of YafNO toxin-antitoxin module